MFFEKSLAGFLIHVNFKATRARIPVQIGTLACVRPNATRAPLITLGCDRASCRHCCDLSTDTPTEHSKHGIFLSHDWSQDCSVSERRGGQGLGWTLTSELTTIDHLLHSQYWAQLCRPCKGVGQCRPQAAILLSKANVVVRR